MQAPIAPSGPPASEPGERACPSCGASNGPLAAFCWQCYRQFGPSSYFSPGASPRTPGTYVSSTPAGLRGATTALPSGPTPASLSTSSRRGGKLAAVWVALAVLGGYFFVHSFLDRAPDAALPATLGSLPRVENPLLEQATEAFRNDSEGMGVDTDMGFYGVGGTPSAALVWVDGSDVFTTSDAWSEFADGMSAGTGLGSIDQSRTVTRTVDGVEYRCAPVVGEAAGNLCMWQVDEVYWVLFDLSAAAAGGGPTLDLAVAAHDTTA